MPRNASRIAVLRGRYDIMMMMMTFITRRGEGQGRTKKERKATKSEGSGLEEGASRAIKAHQAPRESSDSSRKMVRDLTQEL